MVDEAMLRHLPQSPRMTEKAMQSRILPIGYVVSDSRKTEWYIGSYIGLDGSTEVYATAEYKGETPTKYPALLKIKPHGDEQFISEIDFYVQHASCVEIDKWLSIKNTLNNDLGIPQYLGSAQNKMVMYVHSDFVVLKGYGSDLETLLAKHNNILPKPTVLKIAFHIVRALEYYHKKSVVHGDIRASHIRLDWQDENRVYLLPQFHATDESNQNAVRFWSEGRHCGAPTKIGDFESLVYNLIDWSGGILPWKNAILSEVKDMKIQAFSNPEQFLLDAFPSCKCKKSSGCLSERKCVVSGQPLAPFRCLQAIAELMEHIDLMKETSNCRPDYKAIEEILKKRLLNMYQVPSSKLEFSVSTEIGDESEEEMPEREKKKVDDSYLPGLRIATDTLVVIISENCMNFDEVDAFDSKSSGVIDVILQLKRANRTKTARAIRKAWEKDTNKLRSRVIEQWRLKKIRPSDYQDWKKEKNRREAAEKRAKRQVASVEAEKKAPEFMDHFVEVSDDEQIAPNDTAVYATNSPRILRPKTPKSRQKDPAEKKTQRERNFASGKRRGESSSTSNSRSKTSKLASPPRRTSRDARSPAASTSAEIPNPASPASSSGFSSFRFSEDRFDTEDFSPLRTPERFSNEYVQEVRVLREDYSKQQQQISKLKHVLDELPADSPDVPKLSTMEQDWLHKLATIKERGRKLGGDSLDQLRDALQEVSNSLKELPFEKEELLRKLESLDGQLRLQSATLAGADFVVEQLSLFVGDQAFISNLRDEYRSIGNFFYHLKQKINDRKVDGEKSVNDERDFDDSCKEILVWLTKEFDGLSKKELVSTDRLALQQQLKHYKANYGRVMGREAEVTQLLHKGHMRLQNLDKETIQQQFLDLMQIQWERLKRESYDHHQKLESCVEHCKKYYETQNSILHWLCEAEHKLETLKPASLYDVDKVLKELSSFGNEVREKSHEIKRNTDLGRAFIGACGDDKENVVANELDSMETRWNNLNDGLLDCTRALEDMAREFSAIKKVLHDLKGKLFDQLAALDSLQEPAEDTKPLNRIKELLKETVDLKKPLEDASAQAKALAAKASQQGISSGRMLDEVDSTAENIAKLEAKLDDCCNKILKTKIDQIQPLISPECEDVKPRWVPMTGPITSYEVIDLDSEDLINF